MTRYAGATRAVAPWAEPDRWCTTPPCDGRCTGYCSQPPLPELDPDDYTDIGLEHWALALRGAYDPVGRVLADGHYSRRKVGSPQFMPPGQRFVLMAHDGHAVWGWWRPHPASGIKAMNGYDGWTCSIFRRVTGQPASELVLDAERAIAAAGYDCGPSGMLTYVDGGKVKSSNPGYCFLVAGWRKIGWCAKKRKRLLWKPFELAGISACGVSPPEPSLTRDVQKGLK